MNYGLGHNQTDHQRHKHLPGEVHHLVNADAGEGASDPLLKDVDAVHLYHEIYKPQQRTNYRQADSRTLPAAQEERYGNGSQYPGVEELGQEEHGELHA